MSKRPWTEDDYEDARVSFKRTPMIGELVMSNFSVTKGKLVFAFGVVDKFDYGTKDGYSGKHLRIDWEPPCNGNNYMLSYIRETRWVSKRQVIIIGNKYTGEMNLSMINDIFVPYLEKKFIWLQNSGWYRMSNELWRNNIFMCDDDSDTADNALNNGSADIIRIEDADMIPNNKNLHIDDSKNILGKRVEQVWVRGVHF